MKATAAQVINKHIEALLENTSRDFQNAQNFLKYCYSRRGNDKSEQLEKVDFLIEETVKELQFFDTLGQRLKHLLNFHYHGLIGADRKLKWSYLHLDLCQITAIEADSLDVITKAEKNLVDLCIELNHPSIAWFAHKDLIEFQFNSIKRAILSAGTDYESRTVMPFNAAIENNLKAFYSMESERFVLSWFQSRMPHGSSPELLLSYKEFKANVKSSHIEIF